MIRNDLLYVDPDDLVDAGFCQSCEAIYYERDININSCPTGFDISDVNCHRKDYFQEILEKVERTNEDINYIVNELSKR